MVVTPAGRAAVEAAAPAHVDAVRAAVFDRLSPEQVQQLGEICDVQVEGLEPDAACGDGAGGSGGRAV